MVERAELKGDCDAAQWDAVPEVVDRVAEVTRSRVV
jgi:hypothetical protein